MRLSAAAGVRQRLSPRGLSNEASPGRACRKLPKLPLRSVNFRSQRTSWLGQATMHRTLGQDETRNNHDGIVPWCGHCRTGKSGQGSNGRRSSPIGRYGQRRSKSGLSGHADIAVIAINRHLVGMRSHFTLAGLAGLAGLAAFLLLAACSPTTSVRNDTEAVVYVDIIKSGMPRLPSPQKLTPGNVMTAPWPPAEAIMLYSGNNPSSLQRFAVSRLCDLSRRNCEIRISALSKPSSNGS